MFVKIKFVFIVASAIAVQALATPSSTSEADAARHLLKRESPSTLQVFNGKKPDGDRVEKDNPVAGDVLTDDLDCGTISVTINKANDAQCNFQLPNNLVAGTTYTGSPAAGFFGLSVAGGCSGRLVEIARNCDSCTTLGENFNGLDCVGKAGGIKNDVNLCISGTTNLVAC
ncbi:hypothetical protein JX265_007492 [Neoarthrinium moseri]|uniref:Uncharacterized protein n=1 Tax=Neoarthrinium moseri TaxID=1658444 RepID=A0A9P9WJK7_9PEZI|nr:hypothetical protein JX266_000757 [Neoarthrinium moseri]KAI1866916.1 hypothetical protein JX265_007492 [Neoarthrinium moseri]